MHFQRAVVVGMVGVLLCAAADGKDKKKMILPAEVLKARTVLVVVDPDAGMPVENPNANRNAQENVEKALMNWGRFQLALNEDTADLVIMVRKGNGKIARPTIGGMPTNNRPVIFEPTDSGGRAGGGTVPPMGGTNRTQPPEPAAQMEVGSAEDIFAVYRGNRNDPLDSPSVWRFSGKDILNAPGVQAVDAFRKAIAEAEKQQASNP